VAGLRHARVALPPTNSPGTPRGNGLMGPRAGLEGCGISHPDPGFDPRTVQLVPICYTDYAVPATKLFPYALHKYITYKSKNAPLHPVDSW
jgi:hypothetical protein